MCCKDITCTKLNSRFLQQIVLKTSSTNSNHSYAHFYQVMYQKEIGFYGVKLCEISSSHGGEYDVQSCLLGCTAGMSAKICLVQRRYQKLYLLVFND
jgi:hypothetical protein